MFQSARQWKKEGSFKLQHALFYHDRAYLVIHKILQDYILTMDCHWEQTAQHIIQQIYTVFPLISIRPQISALKRAAPLTLDQNKYLPLI